MARFPKASVVTLELKAGPGRCEEASTLSREFYIPCNAPAEYLVDFPGRDERGYRMCRPCMDHNVHNRRGRLVRKLTEEEKRGSTNSETK